MLFVICISLWEAAFRVRPLRGAGAPPEGWDAARGGSFEGDGSAASSPVLRWLCRELLRDGAGGTSACVPDPCWEPGCATGALVEGAA